MDKCQELQNVIGAFLLLGILLVALVILVPQVGLALMEGSLRIWIMLLTGK